MEGYMARITPAELVQQIETGIDPEHRTPLYEQIAHAISLAITRGALPPGTMLPRELEIATAMGISRQTVNQALTLLARRGLVTRRRHVGTVVTAPFVEQPLGELYSFLDTLTAQGRSVGNRPLGYRTTLDETASPLLTGGPDGLVFEITRLRLVDEDPFVVETIFVPLAYGQQLPLERLANETLYDLLRASCDIDVTHADETMRPITLDRQGAALLSLAIGAPAFLVERVGYADTRPVELRRSVIRGDRYRFRIRLEAAKPSLLLS
jgi:GntR family transcriptional regulator